MGRLSRFRKENFGRFIGRRNELEAFRKSLQQLQGLNSSRQDHPYPQVFLVYGEGGMGKTELVRRFASICEEDAFKASKIFCIDWDDYYDYPIQSSLDLMDILHDRLNQEFPKEFDIYRNRREKRDEVRRQVGDARERFGPLVSAAADQLSNITRTGEIGKASFEAFVHAAANELAKREDQFAEWLKEKLTPEEYGLYENPQLELSKAFVKSLIQAARKKPIVFILDTYELIDQFDWIRKGLIKYTLDQSPNVVFVLSGRYDHSLEYRHELDDDFLYLINMQEFSKLDIYDYLDVYLTKHQQIRNLEGSTELVDFVFEVTQGVPIAVQTLVTAIRNNNDLNNFKDIHANRMTSREVVEITANRFLKYCLNSDIGATSAENAQFGQDAASERDYIYTFAVVRNQESVEKQEQMLNAIWEKSVKYKEPLLDRASVWEYLKRKYSFMFTKEKQQMHPVVRTYVRKALRDNSIPRGHLMELNIAAVKYFEAKSLLIKGTLQDQLKSSEWCEAQLNLINHLLWLGEYERAIKLITNITITASKYAYFKFRDEVINLIASEEGQDLRRSIPKEYDEILGAIIHMNRFIGEHPEHFNAAILEFENILRTWMDREARILNNLSKVESFARKSQLESAKNTLDFIEAECIDGEFKKERAKVFLLLGAKFLEINKDQAEKLLSRSHELDPNNPDCANILGDLYFAQGKWVDAASFYKRSYELKKNNRYALNQYSKATYLSESKVSGTWDSDVGDIHDSIEMASDHVKNGIKYSHRGDIGKAIDEFSSAASADPSNVFARIKLGNALRQIGEFDKTIETLNQVIKDMSRSSNDLTRSLTTSALDGLGAAFLLKGEINAAIDFYRRAIAYSQGDIYINAYNGLGVCYLLNGNIISAIKYFEQAIERKSNAYWIRNNLGIAAKLQGKLLSADKYFTGAHDLCSVVCNAQPDYYHPQYHLGVALVGQKQARQIQNITEDDEVKRICNAFILSKSKCNAFGVKLEIEMLLKLLSPNNISNFLAILWE